MKKTSEELLLEITWRDTADEKKKAELALDEFFIRFGDYCKFLIYVFAGDDEKKTQDYYALFVLDIWEKAHLYDDTRLPNEAEDKRIKMWLGYRVKSVNNRYWLELTKDKSSLSLDDVTANTFEPIATDDEIIGKEDINLKKLRISMIEGKVLTERDLDIVITTYSYKGEIPPDIRKAICKEWNISEPTIRTVRYRALKKVANFIKEKSVIY